MKVADQQAYVVTRLAHALGPDWDAYRPEGVLHRHIRGLWVYVQASTVLRLRRWQVRYRGYRRPSNTLYRGRGWMDRLVSDAAFSAKAAAGRLRGLR